MNKITDWVGNGKTLLGLLGGIATFVLVLTNALKDGFQLADVELIIGGFSALMIAIGLGHKAEKILTALKK